VQRRDRHLGRTNNLEEFHESSNITGPDLTRTVCVRKPTFDVEAVMLYSG
jgi:hypothetical protein